MKLIFSKTADKEIIVQLQKGTIAEAFTYTEMVKQLLLDNKFEDNDYTNLSGEEKKKIEDMLEKITCVFKEDEPTDNENGAASG